MISIRREPSFDLDDNESFPSDQQINSIPDISVRTESMLTKHAAIKDEIIGQSCGVNREDIQELALKYETTRERVGNQLTRLVTDGKLRFDGSGYVPTAANVD